VVSKKTVVVGCEDGSSYGYSLKTGKRTHVFEGHTAAITAVCGVQVPTQDDTKFQLCSGSLDEHLCIFYSEVCDFSLFHEIFIAAVPLKEINNLQYVKL
jgi:hypothetical protein